MSHGMTADFRLLTMWLGGFWHGFPASFRRFFVAVVRPKGGVLGYEHSIRHVSCMSTYMHF